MAKESFVFPSVRLEKLLRRSGELRRSARGISLNFIMSALQEVIPLIRRTEMNAYWERRHRKFSLSGLPYSLFRPQAYASHMVQADRLEEVIVDYDGKTILDAGCGSGLGLMCMALRGAKCTGVDCSPRALELVTLIAKRAGVQIAIKECFFDELRSGFHSRQSFDVVLNDGVFEELWQEEHPAVLKQMASLSRGWVIVIIPNQKSRLGQLAQEHFVGGSNKFPGLDHGNLSSRGLTQLFKQCGLIDVKTGTFDVVANGKEISELKSEDFCRRHNIQDPELKKVKNFYKRAFPGNLDKVILQWTDKIDRASICHGPPIGVSTKVKKCVTDWCDHWRNVERSEKRSVNEFGRKLFVAGRVDH